MKQMVLCYNSKAQSLNLQRQSLQFIPPLRKLRILAGPWENKRIVLQMHHFIPDARKTDVGKYGQKY